MERDLEIETLKAKLVTAEANAKHWAGQAMIHNEKLAKMFAKFSFDKRSLVGTIKQLEARVKELEAQVTAGSHT